MCVCSAWLFWCVSNWPGCWPLVVASNAWIEICVGQERIPSTFARRFSEAKLEKRQCLKINIGRATRNMCCADEHVHEIFMPPLTLQLSCTSLNIHFHSARMENVSKRPDRKKRKLWSLSAWMGDVLVSAAPEYFEFVFFQAALSALFIWVKSSQTWPCTLNTHWKNKWGACLIPALTLQKIFPSLSPILHLWWSSINEPLVRCQKGLCCDTLYCIPWYIR